MKEMRENTEFVAVNYHRKGYPDTDFTIKLNLIKESIERHREQIEFAEKYNLFFSESVDPLPDLIFDSRVVKNLLRGFFDILFIVEFEVGEME